MPGDDDPSEAERRIEALEQRVQELEDRLAEQPSPDTVKWLVSQVQGGQQHTVDPETLTTLEQYAQMPLHERVDVLPRSEMRATLLFDHWREWAIQGPYGHEFITTSMDRPATLRVLLREQDPTVKHSSGEQLHHQQVYRAMRAAHRLTDGALRYEENHTTPDNTDGATYHALVLEEPGEMPTLPR